MDCLRGFRDHFKYIVPRYIGMWYQQVSANTICFVTLYHKDGTPHINKWPNEVLVLVRFYSFGKCVPSKDLSETPLYYPIVSWSTSYDLFY